MVEVICTNCGGPLIMKAGQHITLETSVTYDENGCVVDERQDYGWCGDCIEKMDDALGFTSP